MDLKKEFEGQVNWDIVKKDFTPIPYIITYPIYYYLYSSVIKSSNLIIFRLI